MKTHKDLGTDGLQNHNWSSFFVILKLVEKTAPPKTI